MSKLHEWREMKCCNFICIILSSNKSPNLYSDYECFRYLSKDPPTILDEKVKKQDHRVYHMITMDSKSTCMKSYMNK